MYARATTYIFLYTIVWQTMFWGIGYRIAEHDAIEQAKRREEADETSRDLTASQSRAHRMADEASVALDVVATPK